MKRHPKEQLFSQFPHENYALEVILSAAIVLLTLASVFWHQLDPRVGIEVAIVGEVWVLSLALLKQHFHSVVNVLIAQLHAGLDMLLIISKLDGIQHKYGIRRINSARTELTSIDQGKIPLNSKEYYQELNDGIDACERGSVVYAVSSMDPLRWKLDRNQGRWEDANARAVTRGVIIVRIFVLTKDQMESAEADSVRAVLSTQLNQGIDVHIVWHHEAIKLGFTLLLSDFVLFPNSLVLVDYHDKDDPMVVGSAEMLLSPNPRASAYGQLFEHGLRTVRHLFDKEELLRAKAVVKQ